MDFRNSFLILKKKLEMWSESWSLWMTRKLLIEPRSGGKWKIKTPGFYYTLRIYSWSIRRPVNLGCVLYASYLFVCQDENQQSFRQWMFHDFGEFIFWVLEKFSITCIHLDQLRTCLFAFKESTNHIDESFKMLKKVK